MYRRTVVGFKLLSTGDAAVTSVILQNNEERVKTKCICVVAVYFKAIWLEHTIFILQNTMWNHTVVDFNGRYMASSARTKYKIFFFTK